MPRSTWPHLLILPPQDYWAWVRAARDYALQFQVTISPDPDRALSFAGGAGPVTLVDFPGAYPGYASAQRWLQQHVPGMEIDLISVSSALGLRSELQRRRDGPPQQEPRPAARDSNSAAVPAPAQLQPILLTWPSDFRSLLQGFGANPELYLLDGLPGHPGLDVAAPLNSPVYASADGEVLLVHDGLDRHPMGIHIRLRHSGGFETLYGHLNEALVASGKQVRRGEEIGRAGQTGATAYPHLHFALYKDGATYSAETNYPADLLDPTPYLSNDIGFAGGKPHPLPALDGLAGRVGGRMRLQDWQALEQYRAESLTIDIDTSEEDCELAARVRPGIELLARVSRVQAASMRSPRTYADYLRPRLDRLMRSGVSAFELLPQPNLLSGGLGVYWRNGREFAAWYVELLALLRGHYPQARFGWPALSPGGRIPGERIDYRAFLEDGRDALSAVDWLGAECFWFGAWDLHSLDGGLSFLHLQREYPDKPIRVLRYAAIGQELSAGDRAAQVMEFLSLARSAAVESAHLFGLSAALGPQDLMLVQPDGEFSPFGQELFRARDETPVQQAAGSARLS